MPGEDTISWSAPTHSPAPRSADWYWTLGLVAVCGIVASVFFGNLIFAALISLAALCVGVLAARAPRECEVHITPEGISLDQDFFPYRSLRTFFVLTDHHAGPRLLLTTSGILHPHMAIGIHEPATPEAIHAYLSHFLKEEEHHSPGGFLIELLGF